MQQTITIQTKGDTDIINITDTIQGILTNSKENQGIINIFTKHTTSSITITEYEQGIIEDLKQTLNKLIPQNKNYNHNQLQHDDNAHSHLKATLIGQSINIQFKNNQLQLGTWQQIVLIDFDTHPRERDVTITILKQ